MKRVVFIFFALLCALLIFCSAPAAQAARDGFILWRDQVLPALLPVFICADMLRQTGGGSPLFLCAMSLLSGAPSGARLCAAYPLSARKRTDLAASLNAAGPAFICGAFCGGMLGLPALSLPILLAQYASAAVMLLRARPFPLPAQPPALSERSYLALLSESVASSMLALFSIGGAILFFRVLIAMLDLLLRPLAFASSPTALQALLIGALEMVNGCEALCAARLPPAQTAAAAAFLFSFGGVCILAQSLRFAPDIQPARYLWRKLLQGALAAIIAYALTPLLLPQAQPVFAGSTAAAMMENARSALGIFLISSLGMAVIGLLQALFAYRKRAAERSAARKDIP